MRKKGREKRRRTREENGDRREDMLRVEKGRRDGMKGEDAHDKVGKR